jgi:hypothetical protein
MKLHSLLNIVTFSALLEVLGLIVEGKKVIGVVLALLGKFVKTLIIYN